MYKLLILILILTGCENKTLSNEVNYIEEVNYMDEVMLYDILKEEGIETPNFEIDTSVVGNQKLEVIINGRNELYEINIIDNVSPLIFGSSTYTVKLGSNLDLQKAIGYGDNYDRDLEIIIEGDYNLNEVGTYNIKAKVIDSSYNETVKDITIKVVEETNLSTTTIDLDEVITKHKTEDTMIGIDVSTWQDDVEWNKVKENGVEFAIIRIGFGHTSKGELVLDNRYIDNIKEAKEAGLLVGVYFFSYAKTTEEAVIQANYVIDTLNGLELDLPIVFDWEDWEDFEDYNINFYDINDIAASFLDEVEKHGYDSMLYGSASYLENIWDIPYKTWVAHYTEQTDFEEEYYIWQLTSSGIVDGIEGNTDINVLYK